MANRKAEILFNGRHAGTLEELDVANGGGYRFTYDRDYLLDEETCPVSLTLPKSKESHLSPILFPFFYGLLAEGRMKELQCRSLKIDESDHFGRLIATGGEDCIGPVTVRKETGG
jgi:serine/threonine-protein kinase HipA